MDSGRAALQLLQILQIHSSRLPCLYFLSDKDLATRFPAGTGVESSVRRVLWPFWERGRRLSAMTAVITDFFARKVKIIVLFVLTYMALC